MKFQKMELQHAEEIVSWEYEPPYEMYGFKKEAVEYLIDERNRFFAVIQDEDVIGFRSFGSDGRVAGGDYNGDYLDTGGGLRPDSTGKGLGAEFIRRGLEFGSSKYQTKRFRVTIAAFNKRARKVCRRLGFLEVDRFKRTLDHREFVVMTLDL